MSASNNTFILSLKLPLNLSNLYERFSDCASGKEGIVPLMQHDRADENVHMMYMSDLIGSHVAH